MVPAPTVRPPSRIANRRPFSIATGVISSIASATLSPDITISVPAGSYRAAPRDREDIFNRHQERLLHIARRQRHVLVYCLHQLVNRLLPLGFAIQCTQG